MLIRKDTERLLARAAFTLLEMLVVVAIIVALAGVGGIYVFGQWKESQKSTAKIKVEALTQAVNMYALKHNGPPASLEVLLQRDESGVPYLNNQDALIDPWGKRFEYDINGAMNEGLYPDIWSASPYGKIGNWSAAKAQ